MRDMEEVTKKMTRLQAEHAMEHGIPGRPVSADQLSEISVSNTIPSYHNRRKQDWPVSKAFILIVMVASACVLLGYGGRSLGEFLGFF